MNNLVQEKQVRKSDLKVLQGRNKEEVPVEHGEQEH